MRRQLLTLAAALPVAAALAGCASFNEITADVASFGEWPAGRAPGTFGFDRRPSQATQGQAQARLEEAARVALVKAGFRPAAEGVEPEFVVQVGARVSRSDRSPWDDPLWWHGGFGRWRMSPWRGPYWTPAWRVESPRYEREVALLLRDRASGRPLYEARASSESVQAGFGAVLAPMFVAAMSGFPKAHATPHAVTVPLTAP